MNLFALRLAERGGQGGGQLQLLFGEDGAQVEDDAIFLDAGDDGNAAGGAAQALFEFRGRITRAVDADDFRGQRLVGRGASASQRKAVGDFQLSVGRGQRRFHL